MFFKSRRKNKNNEDRIILDEKMEHQELELTAENIKDLLGANSDIKFREILINEGKNISVNLIYVDGLINGDYISNYILKPLLQEPEFRQAGSLNEVVRHIENGKLYFINQKKVADISEAVYGLVSGAALLIFGSGKTAFSIEAKGFEKRAISEPTAENVIKGAKDGFIEELRTNTAICRRKLKSHNLTINETKVGKQSQTRVAIVYMNNIANKTIVEEVKKRLDSIEIDRLLTAGYIEEFIVDEKNTAFPQIAYTERPDKFCENIVSGRVGILIDGLPISYIIPATLLQFIQAPEDYAQNYMVSSVIRALRFTAMILTLVLPAFYVAITSFHHEMIPAKLAVSIASSKEGVPFPMFVEVILMLAAFEVLIEAGLRLPRSIGQAVSIVGALVVGQSAVEAKLLSPATVVVIAITAIASFTMPNQDFSNALRLWRFVFVICSSIIGIFGLSYGIIFLIYHLSRLESFGVPYLSPVVAGEDKQLQDTIFRFPLSTHKKRPIELKTTNKRRMK